MVNDERLRTYCCRATLVTLMHWRACGPVVDNNKSVTQLQRENSWHSGGDNRCLMCAVLVQLCPAVQYKQR